MRKTVERLFSFIRNASATWSLAAKLAGLGVVGLAGSWMLYQYGRFQAAPRHEKVLLYLLVFIAVLLIAESPTLVERFRRPVRVTLKPHTGEHCEAMLTIINNAAKDQFYAVGQITCARTPNREVTTTKPFRIPWEGYNTGEREIDRHASKNLLVASLSEDRRRDLVELTIWGGRTGTSELLRERWNAPEEKENLPEFEIEVSVFGTGGRRPHVETFTLRPTRYSGPLELVQTSNS